MTRVRNPMTAMIYLFMLYIAMVRAIRITIECQYAEYFVPESAYTPRNMTLYSNYLLRLEFDRRRRTRGRATERLTC